MAPHLTEIIAALIRRVTPLPRIHMSTAINRLCVYDFDDTLVRIFCDWCCGFF